MTPDDAEALQRLEAAAMERMNSWDPEPAIALAEQVLAQAPLRPVALAVLGISHYRDGRPLDALVPLARAGALAPQMVPADYFLGLSLLELNRAAAAEAAFRSALAKDPDCSEAYYGLGRLAESRGQGEEAMALYRQSVRLRNNYSPAYTAYSLMCLRRDLPPGAVMTRRPSDPSRPAITAVSLADYGRFAHVISTYLPLRLYSERTGVELRTPDWVGHFFFELDDPLADTAFPYRRSDMNNVRAKLTAGLRGEPHELLRDQDAFFFDEPRVWREPFMQRIRQLLRPRPAWRPRLDPVMEALRRRGQTVIALHLRLGDRNGQNQLAISDYHDLLDHLWSELPRPVLYLATGTPNCLQAFERFQPVALGDLAPPWPGLEYLQDFHVLSQADAVICDVGGFSRTAAALNERARHFYTVSPDGTRLEPFSPWLPGWP